MGLLLQLSSQRLYLSLLSWIFLASWMEEILWLIFIWYLRMMSILVG